MSDLQDIFTDLASFSLANEIINDTGNTVIANDSGFTGQYVYTHSYYVYFGIIIIAFFLLYLGYKFYFSKKQVVNSYVINDNNNQFIPEEQYLAPSLPPQNVNPSQNISTHQNVPLQNGIPLQNYPTENILGTTNDNLNYSSFE
jgi:hypothetical protein